ncbi:MAG: phosphonate ABC transporter ATP-binding protein [Actinobacteria bacterium]|nr:phosphonate ABC transporter ATP-binding protein [Actinomycetota bacterium]MBV8478979.1 phosphonate ABC transporter ATP-binding protein [Actinomycetota bacterium]
MTVRGLRKSFAGGQEILKGIDLDVWPGELTVVLGANGSGKSTFLRCVVRLIEADSGSIELCGVDLRSARGRSLREARRRAAMVFQQVLLVRRRSAIENVAYGALGELPFYRSFSARTFPDELAERAHASLARVGLAEFAWKRADTLSGGQAQRVAIARALCQRAQLVLADEPVASLDPRAAEEVLVLLAEIARVEGLAVLTVLHQPELAFRYADRLIGIVKGEIVFDAPPNTLDQERITALYEAAAA